MDWGKYAFVARALSRKKILLALELPMMPTQLASKIKSSLSHVSRALAELSKEGLVECINPAEKVGKIYRLTIGGKEIVEHLKKVED